MIYSWTRFRESSCVSDLLNKFEFKGYVLKLNATNHKQQVSSRVKINSIRETINILNFPNCLQNVNPNTSNRVHSHS